jgi:ABC-type multidrug transport system fused ATPase/permease subunit
MEKKNPGKEKKFFRRYVSSTRPYQKYIFIALIMMIVMVSIQILLPKFFEKIIDQYIPQKQFGQVVLGAAILLGLYFIRMFAFILRNNRMLHFGYYYIYDLRNRLMHHFQYLSFRYFDRTKTGDIMNRMLDDVMNTEMMTTNSLIYLLEDVLLIFSVSIIMGFMNWQLTVISLLILPVYLFVHKYFRRNLHIKNRNIRDNYAQLSSEFHDSIAGIRVIRAFNLEDHRKGQFNKYLLEDRHLRIDTYTNNAIFVGITEYLTILGIILVLVGGSYFAIIKGTMSAGTIVAFYTYLGYLYNPIIRLSNTTTIIEAGLSSIKRIYEVLDTPTPPEKINPVIPSGKAKGKIEFKNVSFHYDGSHEAALNNISFGVEPGKTIALVGQSGGGKSTLINLVIRFYDPTFGSIYLDGHDLKDLQLKWLRQNISLVLQEGFLFWGTIRENIRYGKMGATDEEVVHAAELANAREFIEQFPNGFDTPLGERGIGLSGGQRQRIAIARAILKNAPILILDEATSALDNESEAKIQNALKTLLANKTTFVIAHRLSTIRSADEIFVLHQGKIAEYGNHEDLLQKRGFYFNLQNPA